MITEDEKQKIFNAVWAKLRRIEEALDKDDLAVLNSELSSSVVSSDYTELLKPSYCISEKTGEVYFMYKGVRFWVRFLVDAMQAKVTDIYVITYDHKYYKKDAEVFYEQVVPDTETYCLGVCEGKLVPDEILRACDEELDKWDNIEELLKEQREMR